MNEVEHKKCPFCNSIVENIYIIHDDGFGYGMCCYYCVICNVCGAKGSEMPTIDLAWYSWDNRGEKNSGIRYRYGKKRV